MMHGVSLTCAHMSLYLDYLMLIINYVHKISCNSADIVSLGLAGLGLAVVSLEGQVRVKLRSELPEQIVTLLLLLFVT